MKPKFLIHQPLGDEGGYIFSVDGVEVGRADHDSHGWEGMSEAKSMFEAIARELGIRVEYRDGD